MHTTSSNSSFTIITINYLCTQVAMFTGQVRKHVCHQYHFDLAVVRQLWFLKQKFTPWTTWL